MTCACAPSPLRRPPPKSCGRLADTPSYPVDACAYTFSVTIHPRRASTSTCLPSVACARGKPEPTMCTSHDVPSVMYLKHRSHTHKTLLAFSRLTAPAKRSIVRPCPIASSPSPSVSGYGEKYLRAEGETRGHLSPENLPQGREETTKRNQRTHHVLICQVPKLTLSKLRRAEAIVGKAAGGWVIS